MIGARWAIVVVLGWTLAASAQFVPRVGPVIVQPPPIIVRPQLEPSLGRLPPPVTLTPSLTPSIVPASSPVPSNVVSPARSETQAPVQVTPPQPSKPTVPDGGDAPPESGRSKAWWLLLVAAVWFVFRNGKD